MNKIIAQSLCLFTLLAACCAQAEDAIVWTFKLNDGQTYAKSGKGTITDGNWVLNATISDATKHELWIGDGLWTGEEKQTACNAFTGVGCGELDLNGRVASVDGEVTTDWTIVRLAAIAFQGPSATLAPAETNGTNEYPRSVIMPTTLTAWSYKGFKWTMSKLWVTNLVMKCPNMTGGIGNDTLSGHNQGNWRWVLDVPQVTTIGNIGSFCIREKTSFDEWHVENVTTINGRYTFNSCKATGTLKMPSFSNIFRQSFEYCDNMTGAEFGATNAVTFIGTSTLSCKNMRRLSLTVGPSGLEVEEGAFTKADTSTKQETNSDFRASKIRVLEFPWYAPSRTAVARILKYIPTLANQKTDPCFIYASTAFGASDLVSRELGDDEDPPDVEPDETVLGVFQDDDGNDKAWVVARASAKRFAYTATAADARWPSDSVTIEPAPEADGKLIAGEQYTFTAVPGDGATFVRWEGVDGEQATNPSISIQAMDDVSIKAVFTHPWKFALKDGQSLTKGGVGLLSDGCWEINATISDADKHTLWIGNSLNDTNGDPGLAFNGKGWGELDFSKPITQTGTDTAWTIIRVMGRAFTGPQTWAPAEANGTCEYPRSVIMPTTLKQWYYQNFIWNSSTLWVTNLVFHCPEMTGEFYRDSLSGHNRGNWRFVLDAPKVTSIGAIGALTIGAATDFSEWNIASVTDFGAEYTFSGAAGKGTFRLPSMSDVKANRFPKMDNVTGFEVGASNALTHIGKGAFQCRSLRTLALTVGPGGLTVDEGAFTFWDGSTENTYYRATKIRELDFPWYTPDATAVSRILNFVPALSSQGTDPCIIYGVAQYGVSNLVSRTISDDETAPVVGDDEEVLGVYQDAGTDKAWVVARPTAKRFAFKVSADARWADDGATIEPAAEGGMIAGASYTITAKPGSHGVFSYWKGLDLPAATNPVIVVTAADGDLEVVPVYTHDWTFDYWRDESGAAISDVYGILDNGCWQINAELYAANKLALGTNRGKGWGGTDGTAWTGTGTGELDFNGTVRQFIPGAEESVTTNFLVITLLGSKALKPSATVPSGYAYAPTIILPKTLLYWETNPLRSNTSVKKLVIDCPDLASNIGDDDLCSVQADCVVLNTPKIDRIGYQSSFRAFSQTDLSTWHLDKVTSFGFNLINESTAYGMLNLPSVTSLNSGNVGSFWRVNGATTTYGAATKDKMVSISLGGKGKPFRTVSANAFIDSPGIRALSIATDRSSFTIHASAFAKGDMNTGVQNLRELSFPWFVPDATLVGQILSTVPALADQGGDPCVIYGDADCGAASLASPATADDGTPPEVGEGERVLGVFVDSTSARKAWVVHRTATCLNSSSFLLY